MAEVKVAEIPNWLAWLIAVPALVVAALFGAVVFLVALGVVAAVALYLGVRLWWLRRKLRKATPQNDVLEAEYVVIRERKSRIPRE